MAIRRGYVVAASLKEKGWTPRREQLLSSVSAGGPEAYAGFEAMIFVRWTGLVHRET